MQLQLIEMFLQDLGVCTSKGCPPVVLRGGQELLVTVGQALVGAGVRDISSLKKGRERRNVLEGLRACMAQKTNCAFEVVVSPSGLI